MMYNENMANFSDYIDWRGDITFNMSKENKVDFLILSQLSYLNFDNLIPSGDFSFQISLPRLNEIFRFSPDFESRKHLGTLINPMTVDLFSKVAESERFKSVKVTGYEAITDLSIEKQFAAMTFILPDGTNYVSFRGTDDSIIAWKEDFNLAIMDEIPAQKAAADYLLTAAQKLSGNFIIGGHSKGGNLSIYSAIKMPPKIKKRITGVYNFDGPGFSEERLETPEFQEIIPLLKSYYPQFSIVGKLFSNSGFFEVVECDSALVMQHDPFKWHVLGENFINVTQFDVGSNFFQSTMNSWLKGLENEQKKILIDSLFELINSTDAKTNTEMEKNLAKNSVKILSAFSKLNSEQKKQLIKIIRELFKSVQKEIPGFAKSMIQDKNDFVIVS